MRIALTVLLLATFTAAGQTPAPLTPVATTAATAAHRDTTYIDANGTAHITRIVPVPDDLSPEAQHTVAHAQPDAAPPMPLAKRRSSTDAWQQTARDAWLKLYPATITNTTMAGVAVRLVEPAKADPMLRDDVLLNVHGGGFDSDSGSYTETVPIAGMTGVRTIAVLYRLSPEYAFPAAVDDAVAVYKELLKTHKPSQIVLYGTSAGAILTGQIASRLKQAKLPEPAALGIFSGFGDFTRLGDSGYLYTISQNGFAGPLAPVNVSKVLPAYVGKTSRKDPVLSPIFADLHGMPPTLFVTSTRDILLSGTSNLHRAFLNAGNDARLIVFDGLPHAFWYDSSLPEALEANHDMAAFFVDQLRRQR